MTAEIVTEHGKNEGLFVCLFKGPCIHVALVKKLLCDKNFARHHIAA